MSKRTPPEWSTGDPEKHGVYLGYSDNALRTDGADLYHWDGEHWTHHFGLYDHLVSHWIFIQEIK